MTAMTAMKNPAAVLELLEALDQSISATRREAFGPYVPDERDVFALSFGKSGTTLLMQMALQCTWHGRAEFDHINHLVAWPDAPGVVPRALGNAITTMTIPLLDMSVADEAPTGQRVIKSHLPAGFCPYHPKATYLVAIRDPKEVVVSSYLFLTSLFGVRQDITIEQWVTSFTKPGGMMAEWAEHTASYWAWRHHPNVRVVTYWDLVNNLEHMVDVVSSVMVGFYDGHTRARVIERCTFEYMQRNEHQFGSKLLGFPTPLMRRGVTGHTCDDLLHAVAMLVEQSAQAELQRVGCSLTTDAIRNRSSW